MGCLSAAAVAAALTEHPRVLKTWCSLTCRLSHDAKLPEQQQQQQQPLPWQQVLSSVAALHKAVAMQECSQEAYSMPQHGLFGPSVGQHRSFTNSSRVDGQQQASSRFPSGNTCHSRTTAARLAISQPARIPDQHGWLLGLGHRAYSTYQQQQSRGQHTAAAAGRRPPPPQQQQHKQQQLRQQSPGKPLASRPNWQQMHNRAAAQLLQQASAPHQSPGDRTALLQAATASLLQQLPQLHLPDVSVLLQCYETARTPVPLPAMAQLLQHLDSNAAQCDIRVILRVLRSASHAKVAATSASSSTVLPVQELLQRAWKLTQLGASTLRPSSVPQLLRCASVLHEPTQPQMSQQLLVNFVHYWLDSSNSSSSLGRGTDPISQTQRAEQAVMMIKAVHGLQQQLQDPELQLLLQPLLAVVSSRSSSKAASQLQQQGDAGVAAALGAAAFLPALLTATHQLDGQKSLQEQQRAIVLQATSSTLQTLAAAAVAGPAQHHSSSSSTKEDVASSIVDIVKALAGSQRGSPISKVPGLVDQLVDVLLAADAPLQQLATMLSSLASLNLSPSLQCMTAATETVCAKLQQLQTQPKQQQQLAGFDGRWVGQFLWACAAMGFSLGDHQLQVLLRHQLSVLREATTLGITQSLWALAHMGTDQQQQQQQQQVELGGRLCSEQVEQLACQLLAHAVQEYKGTAFGRPGTTTSSSSTVRDFSVNSSSSSSSEAERVDDASHLNQAACGVQGHLAWQLSLAAWGAAMCDLAKCKDTVLELCSILALPQMWGSLRLSEMVQLVAVHLWLSPDYAWSEDAGLAAVLRPEQLQQMREAKLSQTRRVCGAGLGDYTPRYHDQQLEGPATHQQQQQLQERQEQQQEEDQAGVQLGSMQAYAQELLQMQAAGMPVGQLVSSSSSSDNSSSSSSALAAAIASSSTATTAAGNTLNTSATQVAVAKVLKGMQEVKSLHLEAATADELFNLDILVETTTGQKLAVEYDGPYHYALRVPGSAAGLGAATAAGAGGQGQQTSPASVQDCHGLAAGQLPQLVHTRRVVFRDRALEARGYRVVCVPYFEWVQYQTKQQRQQYLRQLLARALRA